MQQQEKREKRAVAQEEEGERIRYEARKKEQIETGRGRKK